MLSIPEVAETLERARDAALPGQQVAEQNAIWRELQERLRPIKTPPRWLTKNTRWSGQD